MQEAERIAAGLAIYDAALHRIANARPIGGGEPWSYHFAVEQVALKALKDARRILLETPHAE